MRGLADELQNGHGAGRSSSWVGDLNDEPEAATTQIMLGPPGSELGTAGALRPDEGDAWRLFNLAPLLPEGQTGTDHPLACLLALTALRVSKACGADVGDLGQVRGHQP